MPCFDPFRRPQEREERIVVESIITSLPSSIGSGVPSLVLLPAAGMTNAEVKINKSNESHTQRHDNL